MNRNGLAVRADADGKIGTGHVMRSLALAAFWKREVGEVLFVTACENETLRRKITESGVNVRFLARGGEAGDEPALLRGSGAEWVFLDGYHFDASRQMALKEKGLKVAVMDDFVHLDRYPADLVVNQNYGAEASDYRDRTSGRLLIGTGYVLLREEFRDCPSPGRGNRAEVKRVLVTLGGGEVRRATSRILEALRLHDSPLEVRVLGVAGPGEDRDVTEGGAGRRHSVEYLGYSSGVSAHMKWADVGVSAGGTTVWEMARLGLPSVIGITAKNHERTVLSLERDGLCVSLGWIEKTPLSEMLRLFAGLAEDRPRRESMSTSFRGLVDGKGVSRIAAAMIGEA